MGRPQIPVDVAAFRKEWEAWTPLAVMSVQFGMSVPTVSQRAKALGLPARNKGRGIKRATQSRDALPDGEWVRDARGIAHWVPA